MRVVSVDPGAFSPFHDAALCRALAEAGAAVELVTAPFVYHPWPEAVGYVRRELFAGGAGAHSALVRGGRRLRRALGYPLAWRALVADLLRDPPEIVDLQWSLLPAVERRALRRLRAAGVTVVQTVHNPRPHGGEGALFAARQRLHREADALLAHSEFAGRSLRALEPAGAARVRVVPPGIDPLAVRDRAAARARLGLEAEAPVALFLGLIRPYKGLDLLLEAFAEVVRRLPTARLVVAGLPRFSFENLARQIARLGLGERVRTDLRYLPQVAMEEHLAAADLVVLPYREGTQSAILGAALACDRPVVASAVGGLPEMLQEPPEAAQAMLVPPGDVPALARAIGRLLGDRAAAAELGRRAGAAARRRFTWQRTAAARLEIYRELRGRDTSGSAAGPT